MWINKQQLALDMEQWIGSNLRKGYNKAVYCYFASLAYIQSQSESCSLISDSLQPHGLYPTRLLCPWNFPGKNTGMGSHFPLQGIFPTQGSNPGLLHCRQILYCLSHQGSPRILKWVAYPFLRGSFWPRDWTSVSGIAGIFFTRWTTRYITLHMGLDESQAGIKIAGRNINNLRCADNIILMAESEKEFKIFLMRLKEESEKLDLKLTIQKSWIMPSSAITSWQIEREAMTNFIFLGSKITVDGEWSYEIGRHSLEGELWQT